MTDNPANQKALFSKVNKFAVVAGTNNSATTPPLRAALRYAENDAEDIAYILKQPECGFSLVGPTLIGEKSTATAIKQSILNLIRKRTQEDFLLFYFAGHARAINDDIYFITYDFQEDAIEDLDIDQDLYLSMQWLWRVLYQSTAAGMILIILDCCYAGNIIETKDDPLKIDLRKILKNWDTNSNNGNTYNCLRLILTATGYNVPAQELDGHGLMTGLLLKTLRHNVNGLFDADGYLDIRDIHKYLQKMMPKNQQPDLAGKFGPHSCILAHYEVSSQEKREKHKQPETSHKHYEELHIEAGADFLRRYCHAPINEFDITKVIDYAQKQADYDKLNIENIELLCMQLGLASSKGFPIRAAVLAFHPMPHRFIDSALIRAIATFSAEKSYSRIEIKGSLDDQVKNTIRWIESNLRTISENAGSGKRLDRCEIPTPALREIIVNAILHRNYEATESVHIKVTPKQIIITNPGQIKPFILKQKPPFSYTYSHPPQGL